MINHIRYIKYSDIDFKKWDELIDKGKQGRVYNYSWWLNSFSRWDLIILGDYLGGIPIPSTRIFFFKRIYQPNFIQQCKWVGNQLSDDQMRTVSELIANNYATSHFNTNLKLTRTNKERINQILDISNPDEVQKRYSKSLGKNIRKNKDTLTVTENRDIKSTIQFYKEAYGYLNKQLNEHDYKTLNMVFSSNPLNFINISVKHEDNKIAGLLFSKGKDRIQYILGAPDDQGRKLNALSIAIDFVIKKYGGPISTLDFEGSSIPSVHSFYKSFGASDEKFYEEQHVSLWLRNPLKIYKRLFKS
jgi:hypothetical protein